MPMPKNPSFIDFKEREALRIFKPRITDITENLSEYQRHDLWLLRWLRARDRDINKSEEMLRNSLKWRVDENIDNIFDWKIPDFINQNYPMKISGFDKEGCLVVSVLYGRWDIRQAVSLGYKSDLIRYVDLMCEQVMKFAERRSTKDSMITQLVAIIDFEGFTLRQLTCRQTIDCMMEMVRRFEANYPEILKIAWVVNAPKIFEILFAIGKSLISARTLSKIHVHGSNEYQWRPSILEKIEPDQLPSEYGGSNTCCKIFKTADGFDVFPVYERFPDFEFLPVIIEAGMKHLVNFSLRTGNKLSWNFRTEKYNIGFQLLFTSANGKVKPSVKSEVLLHCSRTDADLHIQTGSIVADKPGTYFLVFDNSFSHFRQKNVFYCARVS